MSIRARAKVRQGLKEGEYALLNDTKKPDKEFHGSGPEHRREGATPVSSVYPVPPDDTANQVIDCWSHGV